MGPIERNVRTAIRRIRFYGRRRFCPICSGHARVFFPATRAGTFGIANRLDAHCPFCYSLERHRLAWRYLRERTDFFRIREARMLHVAPERCLEPRFRRRIGAGYVTGDLNRPADVKLNVTAMQFADASFDIVFCSHVLEHVPDDRAAMREFRRILKPGGWAIIMVPVTVDRTVEDPSIVDPAERERLFGQDDHVRRYGMDVVDRLDESGFGVRVTSAADFLSVAERERIAVGSVATGDVFHCVRQA